MLKVLLAKARKGDPRLLPLLANLKGIVFISGPHKGSRALSIIQASVAPYLCLLLRMDPMGELAIPTEEARDYFFATLYPSKTTYYVARRLAHKMQRLQSAFEYFQ